MINKNHKNMFYARKLVEISKALLLIFIFNALFNILFMTKRKETWRYRTASSS